MSRWETRGWSRLEVRNVRRDERRNLGSPRAGLMLLCLLALTGAGCKSEPPTGQEAKKMEPTPLALEPGVKNRRSLALDAFESTTLDLAAGEMVRITALQDGLDVALRWFPPGQEAPSLIIDSPTGDEGEERLIAVASTAGVHRLEIHATAEGKDPRQYEITLAERRQANEKDRRAADLMFRFAAGEALRRGADSEGALAVYQGLVPVARDLEDRSCEATLLYRVGWMEADLNRWDRSTEPLEQATTLFESLGDRFMAATSLNRCGETYRAQFRLVEAQMAHRRALDLFKLLKDAKGTVSVLVSLGIDQFQAGDPDQAIATLHEARELAERFSLPDLDLLARTTLGDLLASRGNLALARVELEASADKAKALKQEESVALALLPLGEIDLREERLDDAKEHFSHALEIFRTLQRPRGAIFARLGLGAALLRGGQLEEAREQFEKAQKVASQLKALDGEAVSALDLGRYQFAKGNDALSISELEKAVAFFERLGDQPGLSASRFALARSLCRDGQLEAALGNIDLSLAGVENMRAATTNYELRTSHLAIKREYAELQVEILMRLYEKRQDPKYADRALADTEKARARQLVDLLAEAQVVGAEGPGPLSAEEDAIRQRIEGIEQIRQDLFSKGADPEILARLSNEEGPLIARIDQLKAEARRADPRYSQIEPAQTLDALGMEKQLQSGDVLLVYWLAEPRSVLWVLSRGRREFFLLPPRSTIDPLAQRFAELLSSPNPRDLDAGREAGRALADQILAPAGSALAGTRWIVVADGALQRVPFAALPNPRASDGTPVLERNEVVHVPSATVLEALRSGENRTYSLDSLALFGDPVFALDAQGLPLFAPLPNTRQEVEAIGELAGPKRRVFSALGFDANRDTVLGTHLKGFKGLHFATHGVVNTDHPELSGLVLSQLDAEGRRIEGILRLQDIYELDLDAELVVLSACSTGVGPDVKGEGLASLARGFFYAGAPRLVVSLWPVEDAGTSEFMRLFYGQMLRQNRPPALALREAQRQMRRDPAYTDPYYWAGFIFVGDWRIDAERWQGPIETKDVGGPSPTGRPPIDLPVPPPDEAKKGDVGAR